MKHSNKKPTARKAHAKLPNTNCQTTSRVVEACRMFADMALTLSRHERLKLMLARYRFHFNKLRELFGWYSKDSRKMRTRADYDFPKPLLETGSPLPINYITIRGFGKYNGVKCALLKTNLGLQTLSDHVRKLSAGQSHRCLARWKSTHPILFKRASHCVAESLKNPLPAKTVSASIKSGDAETIIVIIGSEVHGGIPPEKPVISMGLDSDESYLTALLISLSGKCPVGWMTRDMDMEQLSSELHPITTSLLCAHFDPGVRWTAESRDGSVRKLDIASGLRQVLSRPGIPLVKYVSECLWKLIGTLTPHEGDSATLWGNSRENNVGVGLFIPRLSATGLFALLQSGLSPTVRRIVGITPTSSPVDTARLLSGVIAGCEHASRIAAPSSTVPTAFHTLERLLKSNNEEKFFDFERFEHRPAGSNDETDQSRLALMAFAAEMEAGRIPEDSTVQALRKHFLKRKLHDNPTCPFSVRAAKMVVSRLLVALLRWMPRIREIPNYPQAPDDIWNRDSSVIQAQKRIQRKARERAKQISAQKPGRILVEYFKDVIIFPFTKKGQNSGAANGSHRAKLVAYLYDVSMVLVKRSLHGMVLEQRLWAMTSRAFEFTVTCKLDRVFRYPELDIFDPPRWLHKSEETDPDDLVGIDLAPLCERLRESEPLQTQVAKIKAICESAVDAGGHEQPALHDLCRVRWDDDASLLRTFSAATFLRELRPPIDFSDQTAWWLVAFGMNARTDCSEQRKVLRQLFDIDPEATVSALLNVAAADYAARPSNRRFGGPIVHVSKVAVAQEFQRAVLMQALTEESKTQGWYEKSEDEAETPEGSTGTRNSKVYEAEGLLVQLIRALDRETARKLRSEEQEENLIEMTRILRKHFDGFGRAEFSALVKEAVSKINFADREAVEAFVWECIDDKRPE